MHLLTIIVFLYFGVVLWFLIGLFATRSHSYPKNPDPRWFRNHGHAGVNNTLANTFKHGVLWPFVLLHCTKADSGHWCGWVTYPYGHYAVFSVIDLSLNPGKEPEKKISK